MQLPWAAPKPVLIRTVLMPSPIAFLVVSAANVPWRQWQIHETGKPKSRKDGAIAPTFFVIVVRWLKVYTKKACHFMPLPLYPMAKVATSRTFAEIPLPTVESVERCKVWKGCLTFLSNLAGRYNYSLKVKISFLIFFRQVCGKHLSRAHPAPPEEPLAESCPATRNWRTQIGETGNLMWGESL